MFSKRMQGVGLLISLSLKCPLILFQNSLAQAAFSMPLSLYLPVKLYHFLSDLLKALVSLDNCIILLIDDFSDLNLTCV